MTTDRDRKRDEYARSLASLGNEAFHEAMETYDRLEKEEEGRLSDDQVNEAIEQMRVHCKLWLSEYHEAPESHEFPFASARETLYILGFGDNADQIIKAIGDRGFSYCLDPMVESYSGVDGKKFYPNSDACSWGVDQLLSRLDAIRP